MKKLTIISGGQTGGDRAALDWAIANDVPHGGWCPLGRLAEDGPIPRVYQLIETPTSDYALRTEWNVRDTDATVVFSLARYLSGGSRLTYDLAIRYRKPCVHLSSKKGHGTAAEYLRTFVKKHQVHKLNVAGPRVSQEPEIGDFVRQVLEAAFGKVATG